MKLVWNEKKRTFVDADAFSLSDIGEVLANVGTLVAIVAFIIFLLVAF